MKSALSNLVSLDQRECPGEKISDKWLILSFSHFHPQKTNRDLDRSSSLMDSRCPGAITCVLVRTPVYQSAFPCLGHSVCQSIIPTRASVQQYDPDSLFIHLSCQRWQRDRTIHNFSASKSSVHRRISQDFRNVGFRAENCEMSGRDTTSITTTTKETTLERAASLAGWTELSWSGRTYSVLA